MIKTLQAKNNKSMIIFAGIISVVLSCFAVLIYLSSNGLFEFKISQSLNSIELIYLIYLLFALFLCCAGKRHSAVTMCILYFSFLILFVCSTGGPDYESYKGIYNMISHGASHDDVHGEILYYHLNRIASYIMPYDIFRVCYLGAFLALFMYSIYKLSPNPTLMFLMAYCGLIVYLISAYRQFATIAIMFYAIYSVYRNRKIRACLLTTLSIFLHSGGIICLLIVLFLLGKKSQNRELCKYGSLIILIAFFVRIILSWVLSVNYVNNIIASLTSYYEVKLLSLGFLSRVFELVVLLYLYTKIRCSKFVGQLFKIYFICMIIYIACPLEFLMARLFISGRFLCIMLITMMTHQTYGLKFNSVICYKRKVNYRMVLGVFVCLYIILFIYQLLFQSGYTPYDNFLFH